MARADDPQRIGLGCMRLSTDPGRDDERSVGVLHAAFDAGINLLDTADAYCLDSTETGHNERLVARAIASWPGDATRLRVATKGGLTRPQGAWVEDGRAKHLVAACHASLRALGVERIHLYQLHAPDPRTPFATSVRALDALRRDGLVESIGLCNVTVGQIEEARRITEVAAVQVELSIWNTGSILSGVAEYCVAHGIRLLAHRPLGGPQRRRRTQSDPVLLDLAARYDATPFEMALAWLRDLSPLILPLAGATRVETVRSVARAHRITLTGSDRARLDERVPAGRALRRGESRAVRARPRADGEIVLIMGLPGAGKSTAARDLVAQGYEKLSRDEAGGTLGGLVPELDRLITSGASGTTRIVADNTYVSRKSRAPVIETAARHGLPVRCLWLTTSVEDAQVNAVSRMISRYGRLLGPEEMREAAKRDPGVFGPAVQFRYQRALEPPTAAEGFSRIEEVPFDRRRDASFTNRAILLWCEGVLRRGRSLPGSSSTDDVEVIPGRGERLRRFQEEGWRILGLSWQPAIAQSLVTAADVDAGFERLRDALGVSIEVEYCPHPAGPPVCWCRKPLPGLGVVFVQRHRLDASQCVYVGAGPQDPGFARRLGFQYRDAEEFF